MLDRRHVIVQSFDKLKMAESAVIAVLQHVDHTVQGCQALFLTLTHETTQKIQRTVITLGEFIGINCYVCIGRTNLREERIKIQANFHVVVGTLGRVHDMISRRLLKTSQIKMFILDDATKLLSSEFKLDVNDLFKLLPSDIQVVLLSRIMSQ